MGQAGQGSDRVGHQFAETGGNEAAQIPAVLAEHAFGRRQIFFWRTDGESFAVGVLARHE